MSERTLRKRMADPSASEARGESSRPSYLFSNKECIFCDKEVKYLKGNKKEYLTQCTTKIARATIQHAMNIKGDWNLIRKIGGRDLIAAEAHYHQACKGPYCHPKIVGKPDLDEHCDLVEKSAGTKCNLDEKEHEGHSDPSFKYICDKIDNEITLGKTIGSLIHLHKLYLQHRQETDPVNYQPNYRKSRLKLRLQAHYGSRMVFQPSKDEKDTLLYSSSLTVSDIADSVAMINMTDWDENLQKTANYLRDKIIIASENASPTKWPPSASELAENMYHIIPPELESFLTSLLLGSDIKRKNNEKTKRLAHSIGQDICYCATNGSFKMPKHYLLALAIHHLTGSAELITLLNRHGYCSGYTEVLEIETAICEEIKQQVSTLPPSISILSNQVLKYCFDNFDLNEQTPSGAGTTHSTHGIVIQELKPHYDEPVMEIDEQTIGNQTASHPSRPQVADPIDNDGDIPQESYGDIPILLPESELLHGETVEIRTQPPPLEPTKVRDSKARRSVKMTDSILPPCYAVNKAEPPKGFDIFTIPEECEAALAKATRSDLTWVLCRRLQSEFQCIPSWAGWVSLTGKGSSNPPKQSVIDYLPPLNHPITENATVQECLNIAMKGTAEVGQQYTLVTFDLAAAKKALNIVWQFKTYCTIIVMLGAFHALCSYFCTIGKFVKGSGFEEILITSEICASGSVEAVLNGKNYNRSLRVHKIMFEALERMLLDKYEQKHHVNSNVKNALKELAEGPTEELLQQTLLKTEVNDFCNKFLAFKDDVRQGKLGKTPQFWIQYSDMVSTALHYIRATKENDIDLYIGAHPAMNDAFFAMDHQNYSRYHCYQFLTLLNLDKSHPGARELLSNNGFSVSRSNVACSRNPVDITIEQTINCHAKSKGGIVGFSRNKGAYHRWCVTRTQRALYTEAAMDIADMRESDDVIHRDVSLAHISQSEDCVKSVIQAFQNFINPFDISEPELHNISSGLPAPSEAQGLTDAIQKGGKASREFMDRLCVQGSDLSCEKFYDSIKRLNIPTFASSTVTKKMTTSKNKVVEISATRNLFGQLLNLSQSNEISLERLMGYCLGPVPWPLALPDGSLAKTPKSTLIHELQGNDTVPSPPPEATTILDGNMCFYQMDKVPPTFGEVAREIFSHLPKSKNLHFVTDSYHENSIKDLERNKRGHSDPIILKGANTKTPNSWSSFLNCGKNKEQLIKFLLREWQSKKYVNDLKGRNIYFSDQDNTVLLTSNGETASVTQVNDLNSDQEEADTKMILHMMFAARHHSKPVIVRTLDTDVFLLLLRYSYQVDLPLYLDTGKGDGRRLLDIHAIASRLGDQLCEALPSFHAFTGCDSTSAFIRKGKIKPLKILTGGTQKERNHFLKLFVMMGKSTEVTNEMESLAEDYVCKMYSRKTKLKDINKLRYELFQQRYTPKKASEALNYDGTDLSLLPPCRDSVIQQLIRSNYQSYIWKHSHIAQPDLPSALLHGWQLNSSGNIEPQWSSLPVLPKELVDMIDVLAEPVVLESADLLESVDGVDIVST